MPKLKTQGVITEDELKQAERDGKFLIADTVTCSYCDQPVTVDTDPQYLYCPQHYQLALSLHWYPGYPAVPYDAPRYKQMHFHLSQLERNQPLFDRRQPEYIAREKGCPFCDRYMSAVDPRREGERDVSLLNQKMFCPECGVSFLIEVVGVEQRLQMRFTPDAEKLRAHRTAEAEHSQTQHDDTETVADNDTPHTENLPTTPKTVNPPPNPPVNPPENQSQAHASETEADEHPNAHTDIAGQIVEYLSDAPDNTARTGEMRTAIGCVPEGFNKAVKKLITHGQIRKIKRGVYQLIHQTSSTDKGNNHHGTDKPLS